MCEFSEKLVALLDGELPAGEAVEVERHLDACDECRNHLRAYERLSHCVDAYCDAKLEESAPPTAVPVKSLLLGAGAVATVVVATVALFLIFPRSRDVQPPQVVAHAAPPAVVVAQAPRIKARPVKKSHRRPAALPAPVREANWMPAQPAIRIAIPADAVLPPGAVPEGVTFVTDVRIASDGSARQLLVWP